MAFFLYDGGDGGKDGGDSGGDSVVGVGGEDVDGDLVDADDDDDGDAGDDFDFEPFHSNSRRLVHCSGTRRVHAIHSTRAENDL